jgi:hypothetical protein
MSLRSCHKGTKQDFVIELSIGFRYWLHRNSRRQRESVSPSAWLEHRHRPLQPFRRRLPQCCLPDEFDTRLGNESRQLDYEQIYSNDKSWNNRSQLAQPARHALACLREHNRGRCLCDCGVSKESHTSSASAYSMHVKAVALGIF